MELKKKHTNSVLDKNLAFANIFGRGRRPFCSELFKGLPCLVFARGGKRPTGLSVATWSLAWPVGRWCSGSGAVAIDKVVQVHPGLEDLLLVGKISPQIDSED